MHWEKLHWYQDFPEVSLNLWSNTLFAWCFRLHFIWHLIPRYLGRTVPLEIIYLCLQRSTFWSHESNRRWRQAESRILLSSSIARAKKSNSRRKCIGICQSKHQSSLCIASKGGGPPWQPSTPSTAHHRILYTLTDWNGNPHLSLPHAHREYNKIIGYRTFILNDGTFESIHLQSFRYHRVLARGRGQPVNLYHVKFCRAYSSSQRRAIHFWVLHGPAAASAADCRFSSIVSRCRCLQLTVPKIGR